jgi:hypothetical protein
VCRPIDRNAKARILYLARALDRRTKAAGARRGLLGDTALEVLRVLLYVFHNAGSGRCDPAYEALQRETRYCRQTIAHALARLERAGIVRITRRLCRQWVTRINWMTGRTEHYVGTTQTTSLYSMGEPPAWAEHLPAPVGRRAPFPSPRQLSLLERGALTWRVSPNLSPLIGEEPHPTSTPAGLRPLGEALDALRASKERASRAGFQ